MNWLDLATIVGDRAVQLHGCLNRVSFQTQRISHFVTKVHFTSGLVMYSLISEGSGVHNGGHQSDCHTS